MISDYDKKYNRVSKLEKSKWTSLKKYNGWKHYEVINIDKKSNKIELFAVCEKEKRVIVKKEDLKNKILWVRGWNSKVNKGNRSSLIDKLVDGTISRGQAVREVRQITRRKAEQRLLDNSNEKEELP
ncbi:MAG: TIGR02450 family Trp-rich protein [Candidatus Marinimicrobia bacterium]|nr:TIGR02450 family Trp-rich protein [Candidatus Neomarinimicrobiota bacterium]|tara:strand:- start:5194 stop:5574 length:381 start_codon:yes stop_codon:yes gene_type:complete